MIPPLALCQKNMKVLHVCLVAYLDGWGYQDNLLPDYMKKAGHEVVVVTSSNHFPNYVKSEEIEAIRAKGNDYHYNGVHIYRIKTKFNTSNLSFYCSGLQDVLKKEQPDMIFHHGINSSSMLICWQYVKTHGSTKFFLDNHADKINESPNRIWRFLVNRIILRTCVRITSSTVCRYYGVTPGRCDYLINSYGVRKSKVSLLPIGCDTDAIDVLSSNVEELRNKHCLPVNSSIIISGGKMGVDKGTVALIEAFKTLRKERNDLRLVLFGSFTDKETEKIADATEGIYVFGWCDRTKTLELLKLSDIACWPIHHTTLIEDAVGCSIPIVVRKTSNTSHIIEKNGEYLNTGDCKELVTAFRNILDGYDSYVREARRMHDKFSYNSIVKQIEYDCE